MKLFISCPRREDNSSLSFPFRRHWLWCHLRSVFQRRSGCCTASFFSSSFCRSLTYSKYFSKEAILVSSAFTRDWAWKKAAPKNAQLLWKRGCTKRKEKRKCTTVAENKREKMLITTVVGSKSVAVLKKKYKKNAQLSQKQNKTNKQTNKASQLSLVVKAWLLQKCITFTVTTKNYKDSVCTTVKNT